MDADKRRKYKNELFATMYGGGCTMDMAEIVGQQFDLQRRMGFPMGDGEEGAKESLLAAYTEVTEALEEINWKPWRADRKEVDLHRFATELTDIIQHVVNAAIAMDLTAVDLAHALRGKWQTNHNRIENNETTRGDKHGDS